jgi:hypothetical protein
MGSGEMSKTVAMAHLREAKGKKLPERVHSKRAMLRGILKAKKRNAG